MQTSDARLLNMNEFSRALGVSRPTARKIAKRHPEYLVPHGEKGLYSYVKPALVEKILFMEVNHDAEV